VEAKGKINPALFIVIGFIPAAEPRVFWKALDKRVGSIFSYSSEKIG